MGYHAVRVDIVDNSTPKGSKTLTRVENEIGSDEDASISLTDENVDYTHATIYLLPEGAFIENDAGDDRTHVNGEKVENLVPLSVGDRIGISNSEVTVAALLDESQPLEFPSRYCSVRILDKCPKCGAGLPINGLTQTVLCSNCQETTTFSEKYWPYILEDVDNSYDQEEGSYSINMQIDVRWKAEKPSCSNCQEPLPLDDIAVGTDGDQFCPNCRHKNTTYPAPSSLAETLPSIRQIYGGEREETASKKTSAQVAEGIKPIVLPCPECSGALRVNATSERVIPCEFCGVDVFLPDELWKKLHPAKTTTTWFVRFDGPRPKDMEAEEERSEQLAEIRERLSEQAGESEQVVQPEQSEPATPARSYTKKKKATSRSGRISGRKLAAILLASPVLAILVFCGSSPVSIGIGKTSGYQDFVMGQLSACPQARELLGNDPGPSYFGLAYGSSKTNQGMSGYANWQVPVSGSSGRGTYRYALELHGGIWYMKVATLKAGNRTINIAACTPAY